MALTPGIMIPELTQIFGTPSLEPSTTAIRTVDVVTRYLSTGQNVAFGTFLTWGYPVAQMIQCYSTPKIVPAHFALDFTAAIMSGLYGLQTVFQVSILPAGPVMLPMMIAAVSKYSITSAPFATEVASAIHLQATSTNLIVSDPKLLGSTIPGPFF